jgi:NAD(P)-dependent dehydrogenase (short-subunit alcohol dehydrogenase family)
MSFLLVTGASRGIGAEIGRFAASQGWKVAVNYATSKTEAEDVVDKIHQAGGTAITVQADVAEKSDVENMFRTIDDQLGPVTGLVNNAGVNGSGTRVEDIDPQISARLFAVNVLGCFFCAGAAIKRMAKRYGGNGGSIVNISSAAAKHGGPGSYVDYAASKGAIDSFSIGLAREQAKEGIRVNSLRPGITMTELSVQFAKEQPEWEKWVVEQVPLRRAAQMSEIAKAALFLLSDDASYVTGAVLDANGGWVSP